MSEFSLLYTDDSGSPWTFSAKFLPQLLFSISHLWHWLFCKSKATCLCLHLFTPKEMLNNSFAIELQKTLLLLSWNLNREELPVLELWNIGVTCPSNRKCYDCKKLYLSLGLTWSALPKTVQGSSVVNSCQHFTAAVPFLPTFHGFCRSPVQKAT